MAHFRQDLSRISEHYDVCDDKSVGFIDPVEASMGGEELNGQVKACRMLARSCSMNGCVSSRQCMCTRAGRFTGMRGVEGQ